MSYLPEICQSGNEHSPMKFPDKHYYRNNEGTIICEKCFRGLWHRVATEATNTVMGILDNTVYESTVISTMFDEITHKLSIDMNLEVYSKDPLIIDLIIKPYEDDKPYDEFKIGKFACTIVMTMAPSGLTKTYAFSFIYGAGAGQRRVYDSIFNKVYEVLKYMARNHYYIMDASAIESAIEEAKGKYRSTSEDSRHCDCDDCEKPEIAGECSACGKALTKLYYIYNNALFCLDDMFGIIVDAAINTNISDKIGLSADFDTQHMNSNHRIYDSSDEFKEGVIDRYINYIEPYTTSRFIEKIRIV